MRSRRFVAAAVALVATVGLGIDAASQTPVAGDLLVTSHTGDYLGLINRTSGALSTLASLPGDPIPVVMAANNRDVLAFERPSPGNVWRIVPSGTLAPIGNATATGEGSVVGADWLQDGNLLVCASAFGSRGWLRSLNLSTNSYTTLFTAPVSHFRHASINQDNGNAMVCRWASFGDLLDVDIAAQSLSTLASGFASASSVWPEPATGNFVVSTENTFSGGLTVVSAAGATVRTIALPAARAVTVDPGTGHYFAATSEQGTSASRVVEFDAMGTVVRTYGPFGSDGFAGIEIYGSRSVHGSGSAMPGTAYQVAFSFPQAPGAGYVGALSFQQRPGITVPGGRVNLALDNLFIASVQGLLVSGFQGTLDAGGRATGTINLPSFVPRGARFFCSAVAVSGAGFAIGNTIGIEVR